MTVRIKALQQHNWIHPKVLLIVATILFVIVTIGQVFVATIAHVAGPAKASVEISKEG